MVCLTCRSGLEARSRFCGQCGAAVGIALAESHVGTITAANREGVAMWRRPYCAENIPTDAIKSKYCAEFLLPPPPVPVPRLPRSAQILGVTGCSLLLLSLLSPITNPPEVRGLLCGIDGPFPITGLIVSFTDGTKACETLLFILAAIGFRCSVLRQFRFLWVVVGMSAFELTVVLAFLLGTNDVTASVGAATLLLGLVLTVMAAIDIRAEQTPIFLWKLAGFLVGILLIYWIFTTNLRALELHRWIPTSFPLKISAESLAICLP